MTAPVTPLERLEQALAELGALTPDGIADRMRALGIKGRRAQACRCVLVVYLLSLGFEESSVAAVGGWYAYLNAERVPFPAPVAEFARRFDEGVYLDLVVVDGGAADD